MTTPTSEQLRKEWAVAHTCGPAAQGWKYCVHCALRAALDLLSEARQRIEELKRSRTLSDEHLDASHNKETTP